MNPQPTKLKLVLIDGLNIVRRVYEANQAPDSPDKAQGAMRSSLQSFRRVLTEHQPTHVLAPFDYGGPTWRHELYPDYKKKRKPMPAELREVIPEFLERLRGIGIPSVAEPGVEADDVIGMVARCWVKAKPDADVVAVSTDKDITVLIAEGVQVRDHFKLEWRDEAWVMKKFGVPSALVHDHLALTGDSSDDIPGVFKVGDTTAAKWLNQYGSLEGVIAAAPDIKGKVGEYLREQIHLARLSRQLVEFKTDMQLGLTWNKLRYVAPEPVAA